MRTARRLAISLTAAAVATSLYAHAAGLGPGSKLLGAGGASVVRCDTDGVSVLQNLSGSNVVSVTVGAIAAGCGSGSLSVTVNNGSANSSGSATVPSGGGSMTVSLASAVAAKDSEEIDVAISGL